MRNGEKPITQKQILLLSLIIAVGILFLTIILPRSDKADIPNPTVTIDSAYTETPVSAPTSTITTEVAFVQPVELSQTLSPEIFYIPIIGATEINLPDGFYVGTWHDNSCGFSLLQNFVEIYGVEIYGGTPPYEFSFWELSPNWKLNRKVAAFEIMSENEYVQFDAPVRVEKGVYIHTIITFQLENEKSEWIDDLRYPEDLLCKTP